MVSTTPANIASAVSTVSTALNTELIYQEAMDRKLDVLESQFKDIVNTKWSEYDNMVLEAAMTIVAARYLEFERKVDLAVKYLRVAIDSCKKSTYDPGEKLGVMLDNLDLDLSSNDEKIKVAMERFVKSLPGQ